MNDVVWSHKEMETLLILNEECSELSQAISKCFRFGKDGEWDGTTNQRRLEAEIGDVLAMIDILVENGYVSDSTINASRSAKKEKLKVWSGIFKDS
jgi:NTP pyrophosphatase (non-canonical NTP hydrolase)